MRLTQVSLFTGIGGLDLAFERAGFESVLQCEIDASCRSVLERHWPGVERVSDVTSLSLAGRNGRYSTGRNARSTVSDAGAGSLTVLHFGSPCQDLSVAGKRAGLAGSRSGLFHEAIRVIKELRPEFAVWENVGGAYSSDLGRDFGRALDSLAEAGALDIAWRFLDAQWFGLAQRRGRVFVVADFRGERAGQILLEPEGVPGNPPPRREAGQDIAASVGDGTEAASWNVYGGSKRKDRPGGGFYVESADVTKTLDSQGGLNPSAAQGGIAIVAKPLAGHHHRTDLDNETYVVRTAQTSANGHGVARDVTHTLDGAEGQAVMATGHVRRLTPTECERLQGFPDSWTRYGADGKEMSDTARYRMLGNAVAVPVAEWLAWRMRYAMEANP